MQSYSSTAFRVLDFENAILQFNHPLAINLVFQKIDRGSFPLL